MLVEVLARRGRIALPLRVVQEMGRIYTTVGPALCHGSIVTYSKPVHSRVGSVTTMELSVR
jgi:hypothetical protein